MPGKSRLEGCLSLAVVDVGAMQDQHGVAITVRGVVDRDVADSAFHSAIVTSSGLDSDGAMDWCG